MTTYALLVVFINVNGEFPHPHSDLLVDVSELHPQAMAMIQGKGVYNIE